MSDRIETVIAEALEGIFATWINRDGVQQILVDGDYDGITGRPLLEVASEIDAAMHPVIDTVEELDALPELSIVGLQMDDESLFAIQKDVRWIPVGSRRPLNLGEIASAIGNYGPARVLYQPEV